MVSGDLQVTSVKFVAKDEYALTGSIDKVCLHIVPYPLSSFISPTVFDGQSYNRMFWNLADSQNMAGAGGWELHLQTYIKRSLWGGNIVANSVTTSLLSLHIVSSWRWIGHLLVSG